MGTKKSGPEIAWTSGPKAYQTIIGLFSIIQAGKAFVTVVPPAGILFCSLEQFAGYFRESLLKGGVPHFAIEEFLELGPVRLLGIQNEGVFTFFFQHGIEAVE